MIGQDRTDKSQPPDALGWVASHTGLAQMMEVWETVQKIGRTLKNFEGQFFNSSTTAMYREIFRNVAKFWHGVRQYMYTRRKYKD